MNDGIEEHNIDAVARYAAHFLYETDTGLSRWPELLGFRDREKTKLFYRMIARKESITG